MMFMPVDIWAATQQKTRKWYFRPAKTQMSLASTQSDQSLLSAWRSIGSLPTHRAHSKDWSDWGDLSLHWMHRSFCWFCRAHAHVMLFSLSLQRARAATTLSQTDNRAQPERLLPTVFKWEGGGKEVHLAGSFNNWKNKIPLAKRYNYIEVSVQTFIILLWSL